MGFLVGNHVPGEMLPTLLETMSDAFVALDKNWCYTYMNKRAGEIFGCDPKQIIGKHIWTEFPEGVGQPFQQNYERAMREQVPIQMEEYYPPYKKWFENRIHPTPDGLLIFFTNITARKRAEIALREREERLKELNCLYTVTRILEEIQSPPEVVLPKLIQPIESAYQYPEITCLQILVPEIVTQSKRYKETQWCQSAKIFMAGQEVGLIEVFYQKEMPLADEGAFLREERALLDSLATLIGQFLERSRVFHPNYLLTSLLELSNDGIVLCRMDGTVLTWSRGAEELYGISPLDIVGKNITQIYPREKREEFTRFTESLKNGRSISHYETTRMRVDGSTIEVSINLTPLINKEGVFDSYLGISHDITEKNRIARMLEEERVRLNALIRTIPDLIWLKDVEGTYLACNPAFELFFGHKEVEIVGKTDYDFVERSLADFFGQNDLEALKAGKPRTNLEMLTFAGNGYRGLFETVKTPMLGADGDVIGVLGIARDVTELNKSKESLLENERKLKEAQSLAKLGNWELDHLTNTLYWSEGIFEIFEINRDHFGASYDAFLNAVHPEDRERVNTVFLQSVHAKIPYEIIHRLQLKDGSVKHVMEKGVTKFSDNGEPLVSFGTVQDITERIQIEEEIRQLNLTLENRVRERTIELEAANKDLEAFAYSVSHDLRAPLRHIDGYARLLEKSIEAPSEEAQKFFKKIYESSTRMSTMVDALLNFSRLGRKPVSKEPINMERVVHQVIRGFENLQATRDITFQIGPLPVMHGDLALISIVMENLISNAVKFTAKRTHAVIEIGTVDLPNQPDTIFVRDNGAGFDMAYAGKLFNVFQRLHKSDEFEGTGIGLAIVKQIVQKHGGSIHVESELDKGTTFFLNLN